MRIFVVTHDKANSFNPDQLIGHPLSIATGSHQQSLGIPAMSQFEHVTRFTVGNTGNSTGVQYVDISLIHGRNQTVPSVSELPSQ